MKRVILLAVFLITCVTTPGSAYVIDGNLSDWGVDVTNPASLVQGFFNTNTPSGGNDIDYITEDNADINSGFYYVGPGYTQGNLYDAEALYTDNDSQNFYMGLVSGTPTSGVQYPAGDLFFDIGRYQDPNSASYDVKKYEFGIDVLTGKLYRANSWVDVLYAQHMESTPWKIGANREFLGDVEFVSTGDINSHYLMEARIPLAFFTDYQNDEEQDIWSSWTMHCGNDHLKLQGDLNPVVPEPTSMLLFGTGLVGAALRKRFNA